jgi:hypothetical protein
MAAAHGGSPTGKANCSNRNCHNLEQGQKHWFSSNRKLAPYWMSLGN